jgi:long-chain fatty acid transport protein
MNKRILTIAVSTALFSCASHVSAASFKLAESSATGLGRAYAGEAAIADNAATQARNPAMLTYLEGTHFSGGAVYVMPNVDVLGDVSLSSPLFGPEPIIMNADMKDVAPNAIVPNMFFAEQLNDRWTWGLGINSNFGLETNISDTHTAAIFGNHTSITTVEFNPNIAYKINSKFSVGVGLRLVYGEGSISASVPSWIDGLKTKLPEPIAGQLPDGGTELKSMEGDDISHGWNIGTTWQLSSIHRLGFAYHSEVKLKLDGAASGLLYTGSENISVEGNLPIELPAFAELSSYHQLSDNFAMHASINWTQWSVFDELVAHFPGETKPIGGINSDLVKEEDFKDNWRFAIGSTYQINDDLLYRAGIALDQTAVDNEHRTLSIPDSDRLWFSSGLGYQASEDLTLDFSFTYIKAHGDAEIDESLNLMDIAQVDFSGEASGDVYLVGMQLSYKL